MRILTIETNSTADFDPSDRDARWTPELSRAFDDADIVLGMFSPHSHLILKGPKGLIVTDARARVKTGEWVVLQGSADPEVCAAENSKLAGRSS